jgi:hypothetical protein
VINANLDLHPVSGRQSTAAPPLNIAQRTCAAASSVSNDLRQRWWFDTFAYPLVGSACSADRGWWLSAATPMTARGEVWKTD